MHHTTITLSLTTLLPLLSTALPTPQNQPFEPPTAITLTAKAPNTPLDNQPITAANTTFNIGTDTETYCPDNVQNLECPPGNVTAINVASAAAGAGASMDSLVPGGQPLYLAPEGLLSYTPGHLESIPEEYNYTTSPFVFTPYTNNTSKGLFTFPALPWLACEEREGKSRIYVNYGQFEGKEGCVEVQIEGEVYEGDVPAWQYE